MLTKSDPVETEITLELKREIFDQYVTGIYENLNDESLSYELLSKGLQGYWHLRSQGLLRNEQYLTLVDFSKSANEPRFYLIDLEKHRIVLKTYVAHGMKTGGEFAKEFSNEANSSKSSLGFYVTEEPYKGRRGYSLRIAGQESGYNTHARSRGVVIHGAEYATEAFIRKNGRLGRSQGCPAIPPQFNKEVIETIKEGSCLFIYANNRSYLRYSKILRSKRYLDAIYRFQVEAC